jgi:Tfp pilus tip-associated adhesin PilY1
MANYTATPPFLPSSISPNVIIAMDISGSMKAVAYRDTGAGNWQTGMHDDFNPATSYYGYFESDKKYAYDATNSFFKEDASGDWDGNFMNWLCMRRIDVARKVMVGGKVRDRNGESIGGDTWYVLLGQHEPYDYTFQKQYSNSDQYTPLPDNQIFLMSEGQILLQTGQRVVATIVNQAAAERVEVGQVTMDWQVGDDWVEVPFSQSYTNPVVAAKALSYNGSNECVVRVKDVGDGGIGDYGGFRIRLQEWSYLDEAHTTEDIMYVVADTGHHFIPFVGGPGQIIVDAQKFSTTACGTSSFVNKTFTSVFPSTPVLFTGVSTFNGSAPVTTRNQAVTTAGFQVTMQEEEAADQSHESEEIHCIAFSQGAGELATTNEMIEIGTTGSVVTHSWYTINFGTTFSGTPLVAMDMQTTDGTDPANLRFGHQVRTTSAIDVQVDEEESSDSETGHSAENVGYLAVGIGSGNAYNIKVGVNEEPTGIIQSLSSGMRMGLAVYNYDHTKNPTSIYTGNQVHGGTFYPCYPDVSLPVDQRTNYDICLPTHCKAPIANIIKVIEEYPLIWGTTPIAETLYEIYGYCAQIDHTATRAHPHFYNNGSTYNSYEVSNAWDPYYYSEFAGTVPCARTFVLHFNDGEPYEDWDDPAGDHPSGISDYDSDGNSGPQEQLDDLALYIRKNDIRSSGSSDLTGHQEIISYYVYAALGEGEINNASTRKMREAAANGGFVDDDDDHQPDPAHPSNFITYYQTHLDGGSCTTNEWDSDGDCNPDTFYNADSGYELVNQLMAAFQSILRRTASGTAASVVAGEESGEGAVYQATFYQTYQDDQGTEIEWIGKLYSLFVDEYGNMREDSNGNRALDLTSDKIIEFFFDDTEGRTRGRRDTDTDGNGVADGSPATIELTDINYLWEAGKALAERDPDTRLVYTWNDDDGDGTVDSGEWIEFKDTGTNKTTLRPYLAQSTDTEAQTLIDYIRGEEQTGYRSRTIDVDGTDRVWKLSDIIYSTPTVIGKPKENYDLIYGDATYRTFKSQYRNRRIVVYVGANDGMLHAFNAGFYDESTHQFTPGSGKSLGEELWAYIPHNLLPHLRWLADEDYSHVYYVDLKPKVIDAQIFAADATHPGGWGTVLVCGMRFGGGEISLTDDFDDNPGTADTTKTFRSAYFALDITNPEVPPTLLWEFTDSNLGFTTSYPAIVFVDQTTTLQTWAIAFGSGPTDYDGTSTQSGRTYVVNLKTGTQIGSSLITSGANAFMGDPISVDTDISDSQCGGGTCAYSPDIAYIGNSEGSLYRITGTTTSSAGTASLFLALGSTKPITSAPSASQDDDGRLWLYFGTGRFFDDTDKVSTDTQALIGVKEPITDYIDPTSLSYAEVDVTNLLNVTDYTVFEYGYIDTDGNLSDYETTFSQLVDDIKQTTSDTDDPKHYDGWMLDLTGGERCITKPTVLGGIVTFTTFEPDDDICAFEGESFLYALYYKTGTAYYESIIGYGADTITVGSDILKEISKRLSLGHGIAATPSLHVGKGQGARAFVQTSTGEILVIEEDNLPGAYKSRPLHWILVVD